jgi:hypothetical protein
MARCRFDGFPLTILPMSLLIQQFVRAAIAFTRFCGLAVIAGCSESVVPADPLGVPPSDPTHHALISGRVIAASGSLTGDGTESVGIGARFSYAAAPDRRISVVGGGAVDSTGAYRFTVGAPRPIRADAIGEVLLVFVRVGPAGAWRRQVDSVRVAVRFAPQGDTPPITEVPDRSIP